MKIKNTEIPGVGLRNIKTSIAVLLSFLVFRLIGRDYPIYACIAAVICTKDTFQNSFEISRDRLVGTLVGGVIGAFFLKIIANTGSGISFEFIASFGIVVVIYLCNLINEKGSVSLACVVYLLILMNFKNSDSVAPYAYAFNRIVDTTVGIVISLLVNRYFFPLKQLPEKEEGSS
ncbi:FUSC family protein [Andreesenia angusta]|nr:aromatic acid exporter family protein [Andreesenia angusta]